MHLIEAEEIVKQYDSRDATLKGVSFTVDEGSFLIIHGRSGCGKTTCLRLVAGLEPPDDGLGEVALDAQ